MSRALVTGGAGFIGSALTASLRRDGWDVRVLDNLHPQVHADPDAARSRIGDALVEGDVRDEAAVARATAGVDVVVHLAAETGVGQSMHESSRYRDVNVTGSEIVARAAAGAGAGLVLLSSRAVYGNGAWSCACHGRQLGAAPCASAVPVPSREDDPFRPISVYGETKAEAEEAIGRWWPGDRPLVVLRPQNVIGPGQSLSNPYTGVLAAFLARLKQGLAPQVYGDGSQTRDFVHVDEVVASIRWSVERTLGDGGSLTLNVGCGERTTLLELARHAIDAAGLDLVPTHVEVHRAGDIDHACADLERTLAVGAPRPAGDVAGAVAAFVGWGWERDGADPAAWDDVIADASDGGTRGS